MRNKYLIWFLIVFVSLFVIEVSYKVFIHKSFQPSILPTFFYKNNLSLQKDILNLLTKNQLNKEISKINPFRDCIKTTNNYLIEDLRPSFNGPIKDDLGKAWNKNFINAVYCKNIKSYRKIVFQGYSEWCYFFSPSDNSQHPVYKYLPNIQIGKILFNDFGWTGSNIELKKPKNTIRLAFVGGSTTQQMGSNEYSYPDYVGFYFQQWANINNLNLDFEIINTGRVAQQSMDFKAIVEQELLPAQPDLVIYYEGRNQFDLSETVGFIHYGSLNHNLLYNMIVQSIIAQMGMRMLDINYLSWIEKIKPEKKYPYHFTDRELLTSQKLPINLNQIRDDILDISKTLSENNSKLVLSTFTMICDPKDIYNSDYAHSQYSYWINDYGKIKLSVIEEYLNLENRLFDLISRSEKIPLIDVASSLKQYPNSFYDGIHLTEEGMKLQGFIVFLGLIQEVEQLIENINLEKECKAFDMVSFEKVSFSEESSNFYERIICN